MSKTDRMSHAEYLILQQRSNPTAIQDDDTPDPGPESELASKIVAHATGQGWPCLYMKPMQALKYLAIWLDITLAVPHGRVIFLELKERKGVLRDKQRLVFNMLKQLGHEVYIVRSFKRYLKIIETKPE